MEILMLTPDRPEWISLASPPPRRRRERRSQGLKAVAMLSCIAVFADSAAQVAAEPYQGEGEPSEHGDAHEVTKGGHPAQRLVPPAHSA